MSLSVFSLLLNDISSIIYDIRKNKIILFTVTQLTTIAMFSLRLNTLSFLSFKNVRKFIADFTDNLLIARRFNCLFTENSCENLHHVQCTMLMFSIICISQDAPTELKVPFSQLEKIKFVKFCIINSY